MYRLAGKKFFLLLSETRRKSGDQKGMKKSLERKKENDLKIDVNVFLKKFIPVSLDRLSEILT